MVFGRSESDETWTRLDEEPMGYSVFHVLTLSCGVCGLDVHREVAGDG